MAIIDPEGLFSGERLAACSDLAQLYWPRFFLAANGLARIEISYKSLVSRVFGNFQKIPTSSEIWEIFREYEANFLAVIYESTEGSWWCQFSTSEKFLPKYKKTRDEMSPAPSPQAMEAHRAGYLLWKKYKSFQNQSFQKLSETFSSEGVGIGIGIGIGEEQKPSRAKIARAAKPRKPVESGYAKEPSKTAIAAGRHAEFKAIIGEYWASKNPDVQMPWDAREGKQLEMFLRAAPDITAEQFRGFLRNRFKSEVNHGDRCSMWIQWVTSYAAGPKDRFGKTIHANGGNGNGANQQPSATKQRLERNRQALRDAIASRGIDPSFLDSGTNLSAVSRPGCGRISGGVSMGFRETGEEIFDTGSDCSTGGTEDHSGPDILPPAQ